MSDQKFSERSDFCQVMYSGSGLTSLTTVACGFHAPLLPASIFLAEGNWHKQLLFF